MKGTCRIYRSSAAIILSSLALAVAANRGAPLPPVPAPAAPASVSATAGNASVTVAWQPSLSATSYHVKRATSAAGPFATVATVSAPSTGFHDTQLQNGIAYYYAVSAADSAGESPNSQVATAFPLPTFVLRAVAVSGGLAALIWNQPAGITVDKIYIYRSVNGGPFQVYNILPPSPYFIDYRVAAGNVYLYQVAASAANYGDHLTPPSNTAIASFR